MSSPYISVIITVYNRTQYVNEAINSVLNQTLNKDKYEIIVVTNVDLPEREGVRIIKSRDRWLGPKIAQGIEEAKGEIISLLEDDDLFLHNKLEVVYKIFKENEQIRFLKNPIKYVNESGKEWFDPLPEKPIIIEPKDLNLNKLSEIVKKYKIGFNNSSLTFRKKDIYEYLNYLREVKLSVDTFIAFVFLFRYKTIIWNQHLSIYRFLSISSSHDLLNLDRYIERKSFLTRILYEDYATTYKVLKNSGFDEILERFVNFWKINAKLWSKNPSEIKVALKDVFNSMPLDNPRYPRRLILLAYLASFLPYFIKKRTIYKRSYKRELEGLKNN